MKIHSKKVKDNFSLGKAGGGNEKKRIKDKTFTFNVFAIMS